MRINSFTNLYKLLIIKMLYIQLKKQKEFEQNQWNFLFLRRVSLVRPAPAEPPQVWKEARVGG